MTLDMLKNWVSFVPWLSFTCSAIGVTDFLWNMEDIVMMMDTIG